jgi:hypothetical protein
MQANTKYSPFMVFTRHTPRLTIDNSLNGLCDVFDEHARSELNAMQMVHKMELIVNVHKSILENVEQVQEETKKGLCCSQRTSHL